MYRKTEFHISKNPFHIIQIWMSQVSLEGNRAIATGIELKEIEEPVYTEPMLSIQPEEAQQLMDELWNVGMRPSDVGTAGHLQAVQAHLEDMRTYANKLLNKILDDSR